MKTRSYITNGSKPSKNLSFAQIQKKAGVYKPVLGDDTGLPNVRIIVFDSIPSAKPAMLYVETDDGKAETLKETAWRNCTFIRLAEIITVVIDAKD